MSYQKHNFTSKQILTASAMNEIEEGIVQNESAIAELITTELNPGISDAAREKAASAGAVLDWVDARIEDWSFYDLSSEMVGQEISGIVTPSAVVNYIEDSAERLVSDITTGMMITPTPEMYGHDVWGIATPGAVVDYVTDHAEPKLKWQYFNTFEVTEDEVQYYDSKSVLSQDIKGLFVKTYSPIVTNEKIPDIHLRIVNTSTWEEVRVSASGYISNSKEAYGQMKLYLDKGLWDGWWTTATEKPGSMWAGRYGLRYEYAGKSEDYMSKVPRFFIGSTTSGCYLPIGFKAEVWVLKNG